MTKFILAITVIGLAACSTTVETPAPQPAVIEHRTYVEPEPTVLVAP